MMSAKIKAIAARKKLEREGPTMQVEAAVEPAATPTAQQQPAPVESVVMVRQRLMMDR
jgi:hypothetical protein